MPSRRDPTIDIAKTIAIVAIVVGHVNRGLAGADIIDPSQPGYEAADSTLYLFHLSCFALLSGCFVTQGVRRLGAAAYARTRIVTFLYLYVVWSLLQGGVRWAAGDSTNTRVGVSDVLRLWRPDSQLWFFGWLCVMTVLAVLIAPWRSTARALAAGLCAAVGSLASWGWDGFYIGLTGLALTGFFMLGVTGGTLNLRRLGAQRSFVLVVVALIASGVFVMIQVWGGPVEPTVNDPERTVAGVLLGVAASCAGTLAVLAVAALSARLPHTMSHRLAAPGRSSLAIFLAHIIAVAGLRVLLVRVGVDSVVVHLVLGALVGIAAPLVLLAVTRRIGFPYLFEAPMALTGRRASLRR